MTGPRPAEADLLALERFRLLAQLYAAKQRSDRVAAYLCRFLDDPLGFVDECVRFHPGGGLTPYQREIISDLVNKKRVAVRGPHGLGKCMLKSDALRLADGTLAKASDLMGTAFQVLAVDPVTGNVTAADAYASDNGVKSVARITTDKGRTLTRTLNHPLWGDVDPKGHPSPMGRGRVRPVPGWVQCKDLVAGSAIAVYLGNEGAVVSADEAETTVLGCLLADGGMTGARGKSIIFSQAPGPVLDAFRDAIARLGGRLTFRSGVDWVVRPAVKHARGANSPIQLLAAKWKIQGCSSWTKRMPDEVWGYDDKSLGLLLNRMFACDGWAYYAERPRNRSNREIGYGTVCEGLAGDVQRALLRLGIQAEVRKKRTTWTHNGIKKVGTAFTVAIHDIAGIGLFAERVGMLGKEAALERLVASGETGSYKEQQRWRSHNLPPGFAWERVRSVEVLPAEPTIAITVPAAGTFLTDFVEHNTTTSALVILWFALTREAAARDWKVVATAGGWRQLEHYLWPEIRKWAKRLDWEKLERPPLDERSELMRLNLKLRHGEAFAAASDKPELIEGAHADSILYIFDESKAIIAETFDAAEGAFSGAEADEGLEAYALAISTPGEPSGRFYEIHRHAPGLEDWHTRHVTLEEAIAARRVSRKWAEQRARQWGTSTAVYNNRVLGEFWSSDEDALVPLAWVEAAQERWRAWTEEGRPAQPVPHMIGVDVARQGLDKTCIAIREGFIVREIRTSVREDTMATTGRVKVLLEADRDATAVVDVIGIGAGVVDRLREMKMKVEAFNASAGTKRRDNTGEWGFSNLRSGGWWNLREMLDPSRNARLALPPDDELLGDLTSLHWKPVSGGKIQVESKDDVRKRIGRSTDKGDAVMQAAWGSGVTWLDAYNVAVCDHCERAYVRGKTVRPHCRKPVTEAPEAESA